jgi:hypothetical protein
VGVSAVARCTAVCHRRVASGRTRTPAGPPGQRDGRGIPPRCRRGQGSGGRHTSAHRLRELEERARVLDRLARLLKRRAGSTKTVASTPPRVPPAAEGSGGGAIGSLPGSPAPRLRAPELSPGPSVCLCPLCGYGRSARTAFGVVTSGQCLNSNRAVETLNQPQSATLSAPSDIHSPYTVGSFQSGRLHVATIRQEPGTPRGQPP